MSFILTDFGKTHVIFVLFPFAESESDISQINKLLTNQNFMQGLAQKNTNAPLGTT